MKAEYKLGIIGFGGMGSYHAQNLEKGGTKVKIKGVYDINPERMKVVRERGYYAYSSQSELLNDPEIDIVLVATTNEVHAEIAIEAFKHGKHVLCEKPVTLKSSDLVRVMKAAKKYGRVFSVDQNRRTNKDFVLMRRIVESGKIGKPYVIESRVEGSRGMPSGWRTIKALGGGMMFDWGVHLLDQIMYMYADKTVTSVYCRKNSVQYSEVDDNFRLIMLLDDDLEVRVEVATNNYITHPRWYVLGEDGSLEIRDWSCEGKVVSRIDKEDTWEEEIVYTEAGPTKTMAPRRPESVETTELSKPEDVEDSVLVVYRQLTDAIDGTAELTIKPEQALRVMRVMEAAFKSIETNKTIKTNI